MDCIYGKTVTTLPDGFVPREQWPEFRLDAGIAPIAKGSIVGSDPRGLRIEFGPLCVEHYTGDKEPDIKNPVLATRGRFITWTRLTRTDQPEGWWRISRNPELTEGFAQVEPTEEYWRTWSESSRRYRKKWIEQYADKSFILSEGTYAEFAEGYYKSVVARRTWRESIILTQEMERMTPQHMRYWIVRRISDGAIKAGFSAILSPSTKNTYYAAAYYHKDVQDAPLVVGLIDAWYKTLQHEGYKFFHYGGFWNKGKPRKWKGFSSFKAKFGLTYVVSPPMLVRFVRGIH